MSYRATASSTSLRDGRRLAYVDSGPADGLLVLYLHGAIGSPQLVGAELNALLHELRLRYVMVSRPGFGGSTPAPGRTVLSFAGDAAALAERLGHGRFAVVGVSAGAPYALACAHELPGRVAAAAIVSCVVGDATPPALPPLARHGLAALRARPEACARVCDVLLGAARRHPRLVGHVAGAGAALAGRGEGAVFASGEHAAARLLCATTGGARGMVDDHLVCAAPWGFAPGDVGTLVDVWHGARDTLAPLDVALGVAAELPRARIAVDPEAGHFFYRRRLREILGQLASAAAAADDVPPPADAACDREAALGGEGERGGARGLGRRGRPVKSM